MAYRIYDKTNHLFCTAQLLLASRYSIVAAVSAFSQSISILLGYRIARVYLPGCPRWMCCSAPNLYSYRNRRSRFSGDGTTCDHLEYHCALCRAQPSYQVSSRMGELFSAFALFAPVVILKRINERA